MADREVAVAIKDIHKEFILPQSKNSTFKQSVVNIVKSNDKVTQKTLDGVSFDIYKGDFFGIVGRNGSGKSTLLKLIAGVYSPTSGTIEVKGGLTPFIELGVGFNPELSGRDNVYLNGALLGFNRKQMDAMYNEIVDFAELAPFMDQKLKNYSSGMQVRLAFSIAIKAKNDILIFDEVLAVGDEAFQRKCLDVFEKYKAEGQTVILVTHDMETVRKYCNRAVLINDGRVIDSGNPSKVADQYSSLNVDQISGEMNRADNAGNISFTVLDPASQQPCSSFAVAQPIAIKVSWQQDIEADVLMLDLYKLSGEHVTNFKSIRDGVRPAKTLPSLALTFTPMLSPGKYYFNVSLRAESDDKQLAASYEAGEFIITEDWSRVDNVWSGLVPLEHDWSR